MSCVYWKRIIFATVSLISWSAVVAFTTTSTQPHCRIRSSPSILNTFTTQQPDWCLPTSLKRSQHCISPSIRLFSLPPLERDVSDDTAEKAFPSSKRYRRLNKVKRWIRRTMASLSFASTVLLYRPSDSSAASATAIVSKQQSTSAISLRPGMSKTQVDALEHGDVSVMEQLEQAPSIFQKASTPDVVGRKESKHTVDEYGDLEEEDDNDLSLLVADDEFGSSKAARQEDKATGERLRASTNDQFAAYHQKKTVGLTVKVGLAFFGPTYGFMIGREYVRRRREEAYVKKGLEILEAQKAEYFNITGTSNDSDVEDALKGLKNKNTTNSDDEDDDDDDDDDDDEPKPPPSTRRTPRKPLGDPPKSGGDGESSGNDRPSAADIDKLNKLLGKS